MSSILSDQGDVGSFQMGGAAGPVTPLYQDSKGGQTTGSPIDVTNLSVVGPNAGVLAWYFNNAGTGSGGAPTISGGIGAMTLVASRALTGRAIFLYEKRSVTPGTYTVTFPANGTSHAGIASSYSKVDPGAVLAFATADGSSPTDASISVTSVVGELVADGVTLVGAPASVSGPTPGAGQTQRAIQVIGGTASLVVSTKDADPGSTSMTWAHVPPFTFTNWRQIAVSLRGA